VRPFAIYLPSLLSPISIVMTLAHFFEESVDYHPAAPRARARSALLELCNLLPK